VERLRFLILLDTDLSAAFYELVLDELQRIASGKEGMVTAEDFKQAIGTKMREERPSVPLRATAESETVSEEAGSASADSDSDS